MSEFEDDLRIDPNALDIEWLQQPQTFYKYSENLARASRELDRLKQRFDVIQAKVDNTIRSKYGEKKPTETAIKGEVLQNEEVIKTSEELIAQKYEVDLLTAAVRSFEQRKTALENMVKLLAQNYFAVPKEPRNVGQEYAEYNNKRQQRLKQETQETMRARARKVV